MLELDAGYQQMMRMPAWKHYTGMLFSIEKGLRDKVLAGMTHPATGQDLTPVLRFGQHLLMQVIGLPETAARMKAEDERDFLGAPPPAPAGIEDLDELRTEFLGN